MNNAKKENTSRLCPNSEGIPIKGKVNDAHSAWLYAGMSGASCYASGEYSSNYEDKAPQVEENGDPLPKQRERSSRKRIVRFQGITKVG